METTKKTDESVKTGLEIEGGGSHGKENSPHTTDTPEENDADELVHEQKEEVKSTGDEQDMDELVHKRGKSDNSDNDNEKDIDDLLHTSGRQDEVYFLAC